MSKKILWGSFEDQPDLTNLEAYLKASLLPVTPRPGYVRDLHKRLLSSKNTKEGEDHGLRNGLLAVAGLATSVLILIAGVRATIAFLSSMGILHQVKEHVQQNQAAPMNPAL